MFAIRVWDKTRDGLNAKAGAIKNAINSMNAAQFREQSAQHLEESVLSDVAGLDVGTLRTSETLRRASFPRRHAARHQHVHRHLATAEAIYDGPHDNLVGIRRSPAAEDNPTRSTPCCSACRRGQIRHRLRPAHADRGIFRLHRHHRGRLSYGIYTATVEEGARPSSFTRTAT